MTNIRILGIAAAAAALVSNSAWSATPASKIFVPSSPTQMRGANHVQSSSHLRLFINQGTLVSLSRPAANVFVAQPGIASFQLPSPDKIFFLGTAAGTTTFYALDEGGAVISAIDITVEHDLKKLTSDIQDAVPGAQIELVPALNNRMIVRGKVKTSLDARRVTQLVQAYLESSAAASGPGQGGEGSQQQSSSGSSGGKGSTDTPLVVNQLKVELSSQVNIQVRVVEVSRSLTRELGFNWASVLSVSRGSLYFGSGNAAGALGGSSNFPSASTDGGVLGGTLKFGDLSLSGLISAMSQEGFASLLAEPNLTAMTGQPAAFASGGEVPVVIITGNSITIDYKSYGVILRMTPTVLSPNRISLHVAPEVSELTDEGSVTLEGGSKIPALTVRRAETTVELASGQSFALAGMLRSESGQMVDGIPGLRNIPFFGRLFEYQNTAIKDTELVILVTAHVVDPVAGTDVRTPAHGNNAVDAYLPRQGAVGYLY